MVASVVVDSHSSSYKITAQCIQLFDLFRWRISIAYLSYRLSVFSKIAFAHNLLTPFCRTLYNKVVEYGSARLQYESPSVDYGSIEVWRCNHKDTIFGKEG